ASAAGVRLKVESVLLPWNCPKEVQELSLEVAPGKVYMVPQHLTRSLFRSTDGMCDESNCRFAVAFPFSQSLGALVPPIVVLDGLGSAMNLGQLIKTARCLGVVSFVVTSAAWSALNGRAAAVSDGWMYFANFHRTDSAPEALRALKRQGLRIIAAEDFFDRPAAVERGQKLSEDWALVLGAEDQGVSAEALALCDTGISVPQVRGASLNVATAAALCLYELRGRCGKVLRPANSLAKKWQSGYTYHGFAAPFPEGREEMRSYLETLDPPQVTQRLVSFTAKRRWHDALELLQEAGRVELRRNLVHCNAALSVCAAARSWRSALELLTGSPGLQKDIITQNAATTSCEKASRWQLCQDLLC
ncbi:unnamed protein product, partial [Symbiodinium microadriaticum]